MKFEGIMKNWKINLVNLSVICSIILFGLTGINCRRNFMAMLGSLSSIIMICLVRKAVILHLRHSKKVSGEQLLIGAYFLMAVLFFINSFTSLTGMFNIVTFTLLMLLFASSLIMMEINQSKRLNHRLSRLDKKKYRGDI
jgi:hypothetical protein